MKGRQADLSAILEARFRTEPGAIRSAFYVGPVEDSLLTVLHGHVSPFLAFAPTDADFLEGYDTGTLSPEILSAAWLTQAMILCEGIEPAHLWIWDAPLSATRLTRHLDRAERVLLPLVILLGPDARDAAGDCRYRWEDANGTVQGSLRAP